MPDIITKEIVQANNPNILVEDEIFKPVVGYEQKYLISNYGNLVSLDKRRFGTKLGLRICQGGYYGAWLYSNSECHGTYIHRLVAEAFIPKVDGKNIVNHLDGNKLNCYYRNLEWCTYSENAQHAIDKGLLVPNTDSFVTAGYVASCHPVLIVETGEVFESCAECDRVKHYPRQYVSRIISDCAGYGSTVGYHFKLITREEYLSVLSGNKQYEPQQADPLDCLNRGIKHNSKCIRIVETGECFSSSAECDRKYGLVSGATCDALKRADGYYGKMDWHIERITKEEYVAWMCNPIIKEYTPNIGNQKNLKWCRGGYPVKIVETGECFATAKECDILKGLPKNFTSTAIKHYDGFRKSQPFHFVRITQAEYLEYAQSHISNLDISK